MSRIYINKKGKRGMNIEFKIGAGGILSTILLLSKIVGLIDISYWWVAAPLIISYVVAFILITWAAIFISGASGSNRIDE